MSEAPVRASGGLVFREGEGGYEVLVVHRPRYDDWSLPKGKDDPGETPEQAAVREVEEETGVRARIVAPLEEVRYRIASGAEKAVRYFVMTPIRDSGFVPNAEVDEIRWVSAREAGHLLTYDHDRRFATDSDFEALSRTGRVYLVRHATAEDRSSWTDDDRLRPLKPKGERQADELGRLLAPEGIDAVLTSEYLRCRQTVEPLAALLGVEAVDHPALAEGADPREGLELIRESSGRNVVACSHGDVIPELLERLAASGTRLQAPNGMLECKKGSVWVVQVVDGAAPTATYRPPPVLGAGGSK